MRTYINPPQVDWAEILRRPLMDNNQLESTVRQVLDTVRREGDKALLSYALQWDGVELDSLVVSDAEWQAAAEALDEPLRLAIQTAKANIELFHKGQHSVEEPVETMPGVKCWRRSVAIEKVGLYIPGGTAPLFSTVLMLGAPARLAGCRDIVLCTPPRRDGSVYPAILYAASLVGVTQVIKAGGAQAIAALAYGTESVPAVYKILGPGNQYVTAAKQLVSREGVAIDMPAGPSEVLVCADAGADPDFVAADLLSQAEHGADSQVVLVAFEESTVQAVRASLERQLAALPRRELAAAALSNSRIIVVPDSATALKLINTYAPEHLILAVENPEAMAGQVINAGSVFLGHLTPESVGDYASGTNHTLPTNGFARAYSGVSLDTFFKKITFQQLTAQGLQNIGPVVEQMAAAEELEAHKQAVSIRLQKLSATQL